MGKLNQIAGDILGRVNPEAAQQLITARHIKRELGNKKLILCGSDDTAVNLDKRLVSMGVPVQHIILIRRIRALRLTAGM